jgi:SNF2 family DNA or RNA helicase
MAMSMDNVVDAVRTPMLSRNEAPRTVPGLANASAEDASGDHLNWWQASNVQRLLEFMADENPNSEGMVLCDAPGLGKTLSVLATIERARATDPGHQLVVVFAGKGIVAQWAKQAVHHFPATNVFCAEKQAHKYAEASATVLADRERTSPGDVYVEDRPSGRLPEYDALQSFSVLILAKEMLSQNPEGTNLGRVRALKGEIRLLVVDESHNLNKKNVTKQESSVCGFDGVPRLLLSGTPGGSAAEVYRMLRLIGHTSLIRPDLAERERKQLEASRRREAAEQRRERERQQQQHNNPYAPSFNPAQATQDKYISERAWREKYFDVAAPSSCTPPSPLRRPSRR